MLPLCNAALDILLLVAAVHVVDAYRLTLRQPWPLWKQDYGPADQFFLRNAYHALPPEPITAIWLGTVPATILAAAVSETFFPNGWLGWRLSSPFDFRWACLHFCFALIVWYGIGRWTENRRRWRKVIAALVLIRIASLPAFLRFAGGSWAALPALLLWAAWIAVGVLITGEAVIRLLRRFGSTAQPM